MIFTAWGRDGRASALVSGEHPPRYANGKLMEDLPELIWRIEADTWNEAMQKYYDLQGWGTYTPIPEGNDKL
jgi:hypothetical protein